MCCPLVGFDMEDDNEIEFTSFLAATMDVNLGKTLAPSAPFSFF